MNKLSIRKTAAKIFAAVFAGMMVCVSVIPAGTVRAAQTEQSMHKQSAIMSELEVLTPGSDYLDNCVLLKDVTEEEAERTASLLGASSFYYRRGMATITINGTVKETIEEALENYDDLPTLYLNHIYQAETPAAADPDSYNQLYEAGGVSYNDPNLSEQWFHNVIGSQTAWASGNTGRGVKVAVLDAGITQNHPDLNVVKYTNSMYTWKSEGPGNYDLVGHGTGCAGLVAAIANNGIGGVGVAPGVELYSYKVANDQEIFYDDTISWGIMDAVDDGCQIITISVNAMASDPYGYLESGIRYAVDNNCIVVTAAGNKNSDAAFFLPAHPYVLSVGAVDKNMQLTGGSDWGNNLKVVAPGVDLFTTGLNGSYQKMGATSGAAPIAAGIVALTIASSPELLKASQTRTGLTGEAYFNAVMAAVYSNCANLGNSWLYGHGCVKAPSGAPADTVGGFVDVPKGQFYSDAVAWAVENKVTSGTSATTFEPQTICTRGQIVTFLWRASGSPEPGSTAIPFTDVKKGAFYEKAVAWAVENGITQGTTATTFGPNESCTRAQIVTFLWRSQGSPATTLSNKFSDVPANAYYAQAVAWAGQKGITQGTSATQFSPANGCTRGQVVTFLYRSKN